MMIDDIWKHCSTYGLTVASKSAQSGENAIFCHYSQNLTCYLESCCRISLSEMSMHKFWCNKKWWLDERLLGGVTWFVQLLGKFCFYTFEAAIGKTIWCFYGRLNHICESLAEGVSVISKSIVSWSIVVNSLLVSGISIGSVWRSHIR